MAMKLSIGKVAFPIEFDNGDKDCIYFNPNDPDLATRLIASKDKIQKRIEEMNFDDFEMLNNGEAVAVDEIKGVNDLSEEQMSALVENAEKVAKIVNDTKAIVCEELNAAFDSDISSVVFKHCSPFAIVGGNYFVMNFLEAITPEIKKHIDKSNAEAEKKMGKHLNKYMKR